MISFKILVFQSKHSHDNCGRQAVGMLIWSEHRYCCFLHYHDRSETVNVTAPLWTQLETLVKIPKSTWRWQLHLWSQLCTFKSVSVDDYGHKTAWKKNMYLLQRPSYTKKQCFSTKWLMPSLHPAICAENLFYRILELPFPLGPVKLLSKRSCFIGKDQQEKPAFSPDSPSTKNKAPANLKSPGDVVLQKHCKSIHWDHQQESFMHLLWVHSHKFSITALHPAPMEHNHQSGFPAAHAPKTPLVVTGTIRGIQLSTAYTYTKAQVAVGRLEVHPKSKLQFKIIFT